jgi:hypothetical protein
MEKEAFLKSKTFKFLLGLVIVLSIIKIFQGGYFTGQWLHTLFNPAANSK